MRSWRYMGSLRFGSRRFCLSWIGVGRFDGLIWVFLFIWFTRLFCGGVVFSSRGGFVFASISRYAIRGRLVFVSRVERIALVWRQMVVLTGIAGTQPTLTGGTVIASLIGTQDRDSTRGVFYESPPGVAEVPDQASTVFGAQQVQVNERSLRLLATALPLGARAEAYVRFPEGQRNLMGYRELRFWARGRGRKWWRRRRGGTPDPIGAPRRLPPPAGRGGWRPDRPWRRQSGRKSRQYAGTSRRGPAPASAGPVYTAPSGSVRFQRKVDGEGVWISVSSGSMKSYVPFESVNANVLSSGARMRRIPRPCAT